MSKELEIFEHMYSDLLITVEEAEHVGHKFLELHEIIVHAPEIISILKRNEPIKVMHIRDLTYACPCCKEHQHSVGMNYCYNCGQKLDWGDINE
mgnify:CR=1 FL=1